VGSRRCAGGVLGGDSFRRALRSMMVRRAATSRVVAAGMVVIEVELLPFWLGASPADFGTASVAAALATAGVMWTPERARSSGELLESPQDVPRFQRRTDLGGEDEVLVQPVVRRRESFLRLSLSVGLRASSPPSGGVAPRGGTSPSWVRRVPDPPNYGSGSTERGGPGRPGRRPISGAPRLRRDGARWRAWAERALGAGRPARHPQDVAPRQRGGDRPGMRPATAG
jgi:hypothetical protein